MKIRVVGTAALLILSALSGVGCNRILARRAFKEGNDDYKKENYKRAIQRYEEALSLEADMPEAEFYLGSAHQASFRPGKEGGENEAHLNSAIKYYEASLSHNQSPDSKNLKKVRQNTLAALVAIYSDDPHKDFAKAKQYADQLVADTQNDPRSLYAMAALYEKFQKTDDAEKTYGQVYATNFPDPADKQKACGAYAAFLNKPLWDGRSKFDAAIKVLEDCAALQPKDASGYYKVATFYWDKAYRDPLLDDNAKAAYTEHGMEAVDKALAIKPEYWEALVTKGLLLRVKSTIEKNSKLKQQYIDQALALQKQAMDLRKEQQPAAASPSPAAGK